MLHAFHSLELEKFIYEGKFQLSLPFSLYMCVVSCSGMDYYFSFIQAAWFQKKIKSDL